ncbi:MAG: hypothetical protein ACU843_07735, partial [Gammaproteobacteria bacterium]
RGQKLMQFDPSNGRSRIGSIYRWNIPNLDQIPIVEIFGFGRLNETDNYVYAATVATCAIIGVSLFTESCAPWQSKWYEFLCRSDIGARRSEPSREKDLLTPYKDPQLSEGAIGS